MHKVICLSFVLFISLACSSQVANPVNWSFSAKKVSEKAFEVHMVATIENGWHIYSQTTPQGGPVPTTISFVINPLITLIGSVEEAGKLEQHHEKLFGVDVKQFSNKVDFVQIIKLKKSVKTNVAGAIEFMVCNDRECLPPTTQKFSVRLN